MSDVLLAVVRIQDEQADSPTAEATQGTEVTGQLVSVSRSGGQGEEGQHSIAEDSGRPKKRRKAKLNPNCRPDCGAHDSQSSNNPNQRHPQGALV